MLHRCTCVRPSPALARALVPLASSSPRITSPASRRPHSTSSRPVPRQEDLPTTDASLYPGHVPVNPFQRALLTLGSAVMGLVDTHRHDMIATLSETSSPLASLRRLQSHLRSSPSGRALLRTRPTLNSATVSLASLAALPPGTLGHAYAAWLARNRVSPDTRDPVRYVPGHSDGELAYVMRRYRESHDLYHVVLGFGVSLPAEVVVKWFEASNFGLPVAVLSGLVGPLRMERDERRRLWRTYGPWALRAGARAQCLIGVPWEQEWETPLDELRQKWGVERPPVGFKAWRDEGRRLEALRRNAEGV
ncbi:hypothetical protein JCM9279_007275 [Rhodotorula babjevae]